MSTKPKAAKTARFSEEACAAWQRDQLDPDNWLRIPEFGVLPSDVRFKGFAFPIVDPNTYDDAFANGMREMVTKARQLARAEFPTLKDLQACAGGAFDILAPALLGDAPPPTLNGKQRVALRYQSAMSAFEMADRQRHESLLKPITKWTAENGHRAAQSFAQGASVVLQWLTGAKFDERALKAIAGMRHGASVAGTASGKKRRAASAVPDADSLQREAAALIASGKSSRSGVAGMLARKYKCSAGHIRKRIKRD